LEDFIVGSIVAGLPVSSQECHLFGRRTNANGRQLAHLYWPPRTKQSSIKVSCTTIASCGNEDQRHLMSFDTTSKDTAGCNNLKGKRYCQVLFVQRFRHLGGLESINQSINQSINPINPNPINQSNPINPINQSNQSIQSINPINQSVINLNQSINQSNQSSSINQSAAK
jgi:hypothetical protein